LHSCGLPFENPSLFIIQSENLQVYEDTYPDLPSGNQYCQLEIHPLLDYFPIEMHISFREFPAGHVSLPEGSSGKTAVSDLSTFPKALLEEGCISKRRVKISVFSPPNRAPLPNFACFRAAIALVQECFVWKRDLPSHGLLSAMEWNKVNI